MMSADSSETRLRHLRDVVTVQRVCGTGQPDDVEWALDEIERLRAQCASLVEALVIFTASSDVWWEKDDKVVVRVHRADYAFAAEVAATSTKATGAAATE